MEMIKVESSNVIAVGHDGKDLYVEYPAGVYKYNDVPVTIYEKLLKAPSKGRFMNEEIRNNYEYTRIPGNKKI